jgi:uncharacterized protein YjbI with pentapeptide repeats
VTEPPPPERDDLKRRLDMAPIRLALAATIGAVVALVIVFVVGGFLVLGAPGIERKGQLTVGDVFELLKLSFAVVAGLGAVVALVMAYRRQRVAEAENLLAEAVQAHRRWVDEQTQQHQELIAADARHDAAERRLTELYTAAADQLGSDKAPVRLAGLYALARLAQANPDHRQTVVNLLCAYLRMPWTPPPQAAGDAGPAATAAPDAREEREVRLTAQRILSAHLKPDATAFWPDVDLDLTGAALENVDLRGARVSACSFADARFTGSAVFTGATFDDRVTFAGAVFAAPADFIGASFLGDVVFDHAEFHYDVIALEAVFTSVCSMVGARFAGDAVFEEAQVRGGLSADGAVFESAAVFRRAELGRSSFRLAKFARDTFFTATVFDDIVSFGGAAFPLVSFDDAAFRANVDFRTARFKGAATFAGANFAEGATFDAAHVSPEFSLDGARVSGSDARKERHWPAGWAVTNRNGSGWELVRVA